MKFLLKLKHWQLFLLTWGPALLMDVFLISDPAMMVKVFPFVMLLFTASLFGWIWAISTVLHKKLPAGIDLKIQRFKVLFIIPVIYIILICVFLAYQFLFATSSFGNDMGGAFAAVVVIVHLVSMVIIFWGVRFAAKTMKTIELGRMAHFSDYAGEFFLIWMSPIGVWVLQPRLNKLVTH